MKKYIDFDAIQELFDKACAECRDTCEEFDGFYADCDQCILHGVIEKAKLIPPADVARRMRGYWIYKHSEDGYDFRCSYCGTYSKYDSMHCNECGAIMDGISV